MAIEKRLQKIVMEMDYKELFLVFTNKYSLIDWKGRPLVRDIQERIKLNPECKIKLIKREANVVADWLTRNAKKKGCACLEMKDIYHHL